ncbi:uncharacterized protein LOC114358586 [Ostrinia furnacalis]|uniref:uncharacterized protein LOC114358586 n=1 Tax=Ostrinia furnacalis TaxID=93504 RepID=UPI00103CA577|nr:uncharacterized protein LOC114358586 [Ostrinia furnacalis]
MLSDALEGLLLCNAGSESAEQLGRVAAERARVMMASEQATTRSGGLNITDTLLAAIKDNHLLQTKELPAILTLILETDDTSAKNTFKTAYKILLDSYELYNKQIIEEIIEKLMRNIQKNKTDLSKDVFVKLFKDKVKMTLEFFNSMPNFDRGKIFTFINTQECSEREIYFIAEAKLSLTDEKLGEILNGIDRLGVNYDGTDEFAVKAILKFLSVYATELIGKFTEPSLKLIKKIISNMPPKYIIHLQKQFNSCVSKYHTIIGEPDILISFKDWYKRYDIKTKTENINKDNIHKEYSLDIKALKIYSELLKIPAYICDDSILNLCDTVLNIYTENGEKYIDIYKEYLSDMLNISLRLKIFDEITQHIVKSHNKTGLKFIKYFIDVYSVYFIKKPYILMGTSNEISAVLGDVLKSCLKKKMTVEDSVKVLELIDTIWPVYQAQSTFEDKCSLLSHTTRLPVRLAWDTVPMQFVSRAIVGAGGERLVGTLPGGDECR